MLSGLESAKYKLIRATEHLKTIGTHVAKYAGEEHHKILTRPDGSETIAVEENPPIEISILAGELVYQVRSALDHLAFDIVQSNFKSISLPDDWIRNCVFPLWLKTPKQWQYVPPVPQRFFERVLPGIPAEAYALIEEVQPYRQTNLAKHLRLLVQLSNIDKHRRLNLTKPRLDSHEMVVTPRASYSLTKRIEDRSELVPFASFASVDEGESVTVERSFSANVSFSEPILEEYAKYQTPVEEVLKICLDAAQFEIIPKFEEFLKRSSLSKG